MRSQHRLPRRARVAALLAGLIGCAQVPHASLEPLPERPVEQRVVLVGDAGDPAGSQALLRVLGDFVARAPERT